MEKPSEDWNRPPRAVVGSSSLEVFQKHGDVALEDMAGLDELRGVFHL